MRSRGDPALGGECLSAFLHPEAAPDEEQTLKAKAGAQLLFKGLQALERLTNGAGQ